MVATDPPWDLDDPRLYLNRELSLLEFQRRVLEEAHDDSNPLLERVKFLSIFSSNLDEFFMVRVAGLWHQIDAGVTEHSPDGQTPTETLAAIRRAAHELMQEARGCLREKLLPALAEAGIHVLDHAALTTEERAWARRHFEEVLFPVLTPLAFDPSRPFPHISNLSLNLAVRVHDADDEESFARVKVPDTLPRLVQLPTDPVANRGLRLVWLEQVVAANLDLLFPGLEVVAAYPFRVTRDADTEIQEIEADDLLETVEQSMRQRRFGAVLRITTDTAMPDEIRGIMFENLELDPIDVYTFAGPMGLSSLQMLAGLDRPDLKFRPFTPSVPAAFNGDLHEGDPFAAIRANRGLLLHHPYESFTPVVDFLRTAARDPKVLAIKMTLYRVGQNSPVVEALLEANQLGKQVAVLVELKARFDEASNIGWARRLEREGVHVVYGLLGLKTHSKIALVVRREGDGIRRYLQMATGNYNPVTAHAYTDLGYFTCDEDMGADATDLFNYLTGYSNKRAYRKLLVAPMNLRERMEQLIRREIDHARGGRPARLIFKTNALVDKGMIRLLYQASQAGVAVDLLVRGICCLRPQLRGVSENIRVTSIVGRFLEHSRIYYFGNAGDEEVYLGSADLMPRNIDRRVEILFPVEEASLVRQLRDEVLQAYMNDNAKARMLQADGSYLRSHANGAPESNSQSYLLMRNAAGAAV